MGKFKILYMLITIYSSLVLGVYLKAKMLHINNINIVKCSIIPLIIFVNAIKEAIGYASDETTTKDKVKVFLSIIRDDVIHLPILISHLIELSGQVDVKE